MQSRLKQAALRQQACIQDIDHTLPRGLDPALMQSLYSGQWIKEHLNILICGPTGIGKSYIACALGHQACLQGARVKYLRIPRLLPQLALAQRRWLLSENDQPDGANGFDYFRRLGALSL